MKISLDSEAKLPTKYGEFKLQVYRNNGRKKAHLALIKGLLNKKGPVLVRIHSECITGETFHSLKCDCGAQLESSMKKIGKDGGVLIYLRQEGRGIGLVNKIRAYALQDKGLDTVEANEKLGFKADLRRYEIAAEILKKLGIKKVKLLTSNPQKEEDLKKFGIDVAECVLYKPKVNSYNAKYLKTKREKMGHRIHL